VKRSRFQDYLIEVSQDHPEGSYQAVISRRDGKHISTHDGSANLVVAIKHFATANEALAEAYRLIKAGSVT
jgi:hypothetical protein